MRHASHNAINFAESNPGVSESKKVFFDKIYSLHLNWLWIGLDGGRQSKSCLFFEVEESKDVATFGAPVTQSDRLFQSSTRLNS